MGSKQSDDSKWTPAPSDSSSELQIKGFSEEKKALLPFKKDEATVMNLIFETRKNSKNQFSKTARLKIPEFHKAMKLSEE